MWIELSNGKRLYFPDAAKCYEEGKWLQLMTRRGREIANVQLCFVAAYWFDTEKEASDAGE